MRQPPFVLRYDGSFAGLLCCVQECRHLDCLPEVLIDEETPSLFLSRQIPTDETQARRVWALLRKRAGERAREMVTHAYLCEKQDKAQVLAKFIYLCLAQGAEVPLHTGDKTVNDVFQMERSVLAEAHRMLGFVRFSLVGGVLVSVIEPRHAVLLLLQPHFCDRFGSERFLIFDQAHGQVLVHRPKDADCPAQARIVPLARLDLPNCAADEARLARLWADYVQNIAIEERENLAAQCSHMPKRLRNHLTEMQTPFLEGSQYLRFPI